MRWDLEASQNGCDMKTEALDNVPFFFFSVRVLVARLVVFSLGILKGVDGSDS